MGGEADRPTLAGKWADAYRDRWKWDGVAWGTHCVDCYPSNCPHCEITDPAGSS